MELGSVATTTVRPPHERPPLVLVVDDEPAIRMICAENLRRDGYEVIEAGNGQEAFELALTAAPDLMLIDIGMPVLDGFGLAAALRAHEQTSRIPFVILTGELDPLTRARAWDAGAVGFFPKPFDPAAVGAFVRRQLAHVWSGSTLEPATGHAV